MSNSAFFMKSMCNRLISRSLAPNSDESLGVKVLHEIVSDFSRNRYALKAAKTLWSVK